MKHQDPSMDDAADVKKAYNELPGVDVPAKLDARILARAREAASKPGNIVELKQLAIRRWAIPITAAASVVVVMSVVYETQFSSPRDSSVAVTTSTGQGATTPLQDDRTLAPASPEPKVAAEKPAAARVGQMADAARANAILPPPPVVAPVVGPPAVSLSESIASAPPAPVIPAPMPSPAPSERAMVAKELRQEKKEQENKEQESKEAEHAKASVVAAQGQLLGMAAKQADAKSLLVPLGSLAGHYKYESYRMVLLSGQVLGLKELGATSVTLDISAQGTLTLRMTMTNGKTSTQTAKILDAKLDGNRGYWIVQWSDMSYPIKVDIALEKDKLLSKTQFENLADTPRFGNVEQAVLRRTQTQD